MTTERRAYWLAYFRDVADLMGLRDLPIELLDKPADDDANISVNLLHGRNLVEVRLHPDWDGMPPDKQRWALVHDLHHCHMRRTYIYVEKNLARYMSERERDAWLCNFSEQFENDTDAIARAWAETLPLPPTEQTP